MPHDKRTPEARIAGAAALLADIRQGRHAPVPGLPDGLRPLDIAEAEAIQLATYAALGWGIGGWKVARGRPGFFAAPMPDATMMRMPTSPLQLPAGAGVELELALRLRHGIAVADLPGLVPAEMPQHADLVVLFEIVGGRYLRGAPITEPERIADCVANIGAVFGMPVGPWSWPDMERPHMRLFFDEVEVARNDGPHRQAPLVDLVDAWRGRCVAMSHAPKAGEVITLGSLTGLLDLPASGARLRGEFVGRGAVACEIGPLLPR